MSNGETIGLVLAALTAGAALGVGAAVLCLFRRERLDALMIRRIDAGARWLAARATLSRETMSYVMAVRALARTERDSQYRTVRRVDASHVRDAWRGAMRELDQAEAALIAWSGDPSTLEVLARCARVTPGAIRSAIDGDRCAVDRLSRKLADSDRRAVEEMGCGFTRGRSAQPTTHLPRRITIQVLRYVEAIVNGLARP